MRANEGVRRLSPVIGFLAALPPLFLAISGLIVEWPKRLPEIVGIEIGGGGCFLLGWCAVRVIAWIVEGRSPEALPENVLAAMRLNHLDFEAQAWGVEEWLRGPGGFSSGESP